MEKVFSVMFCTPSEFYAKCTNLWFFRLLPVPRWSISISEGVEAESLDAPISINLSNLLTL